MDAYFLSYSFPNMCIQQQQQQHLLHFGRHGYSGRHGTYNRLDYFFMHKNNITQVKECKISSINMSDHAAIFLTLTMQAKKETE